MPTFGERLRELRSQAGLTQTALAEASRLPIGSIRNYEQGQRVPLWDVVFRLTAALGVSSEAFRVCIDDAGVAGPEEPLRRGRPPKVEPEEKPAPKRTRKRPS